MGNAAAEALPVPRTWTGRALRLGRTFGLLYAGLMAALVFLEDTLVYRACPASRNWADPPQEFPVQDVTIVSADGTHLHAWWAEPPCWQPDQGALLFCHGNGGNLSHRARELMHWLDHGLAGLIFDYPGFGKSEGEPSEAGCYAAGDACFDWLVQKMQIAPERIVLYGGSLGSGVAVDLATRRPHRALVLVSAFTSMPDMAQRLFPWAPARWLARNQFNNLEKIIEVKGPVVVAHGRTDDLIPYSQGQQLYAAILGPKAFVTMPNYRHKDFPNVPDYPALMRFLDEQAPLGRSAPIGAVREQVDSSAVIGGVLRRGSARMDN